MINPGQLPPLGMEIPMKGAAVNVPLQLDVLGVVVLDFKGKAWVRSEQNLASGHGGVKLKVYGFDFSADSPVLGKVTLSKAQVDTTPLSLLELLGTVPPLCRSTFFFDWNLTIESPPGGGEPWVWSAKRTASLKCDNMAVFLPQDSLYQLEQPVEMAPMGAPNQGGATLLQFPVTLSYGR